MIMSEREAMRDTRRGVRDTGRGEKVRPEHPTSNIQHPTSMGKGQEGVAVVLVVGLLSIMMLMAVAFSITMRIERKGAGGHRFGVQARHMLNAALHEAMHEIDLSLDGGLGGTNFYIYPPWAVRESAVNDTGSTVTAVMSAEAVRFIPASLLSAAKAASPRWVEIKVKSEGSSEEVTRGRYAYVAINCSGLVDANIAGGTNRLYGEDPAELQLGALGDFTTVDAYDFLADRDAHMRYETLPEMDSLNAGLESYDDSSSPSHLVVYSRAEKGQMFRDDGVVSNKVDIGGPVSSLLTNRAAIVEAFERSGITDGDAVFEHLLDYIDEDSVPGNLAGPGTEAVPMINEVAIENGGVLPTMGSFDVSVEWFYPFVAPATSRFDLVTEIGGGWTNQTTGEGVAISRVATNDCGYNAGIDTRRHHVVTIADVASPFSWDSNDVVRVTIDLKMRVQLKDGTPVDEVPSPQSDDPLSLNSGDLTLLGPGTPVAFKMGMECVDPRFNWDTEPALMWFDTGLIGGNHSLFATNQYTIGYFDLAQSSPIPSIDQGADMYVANRGYLVSVGELGRLVRGAKTGIFSGGDYFKTIRLYHHRFPPEPTSRKDEVLEQFTTRSGFVRGLVNVNTTNRTVLGAVFEDLPLVYEGSGRRLDAGEVWDVGDAILGSGAYYYDLGDLGEIDWRDEFQGWTDLERESIIAHSEGLLTVRQNLFLILFRVESYSLQIGGERAAGGQRLASALGVAMVWRDPFRDDYGNHRHNIRYFEILEQ